MSGINPRLYMRGFWRRMRLCAVCLTGLALLSHPLVANARRLKTLGLDGTDPAYEQSLRANNYQQPPKSD